MLCPLHKWFWLVKLRTWSSSAGSVSALSKVYLGANRGDNNLIMLVASTADGMVVTSMSISCLWRCLSLLFFWRSLSAAAAGPVTFFGALFVCSVSCCSTFELSSVLAQTFDSFAFEVIVIAVLLLVSESALSRWMVVSEESNLVAAIGQRGVDQRDVYTVEIRDE